VRVGCRESRAAEITVKAMEGAEDLDVQALKDSPAYGARTVQIVAAGTGEVLPGPMICGDRVVGAARPITVTLGSGWRAGWASEAVVVPVEPSGQHNRR
jgi:hypothetical protein